MSNGSGKTGGGDKIGIPKWLVGFLLGLALGAGIGCWCGCGCEECGIPQRHGHEGHGHEGHDHPRGPDEGPDPLKLKS